MKVGTGRAEIRFPVSFFPSEGFTKVLTPLFVRTFVVKEQEGFALLSLELTSLPEPEVNYLRDLLSKETAIIKDNCWVTVTHTFSAPHFLPQNQSDSEEHKRRNEILHNVIEDAAKEAILQAKSYMTEARLSFGITECQINVNRDLETAEGWWVGNSGEGPSDKMLSVLSAIDLADKPIAVLMHYPVQSSIMDGSFQKEGGKAVTSDLAGKAASILEERYPNSTAIFLMGAAGDQAPVKKAKTVVLDQEHQMVEVDDFEKGILYVEELGSQMVQCVSEAMDKAGPLQEAPLKCCSREFSVPVKHMNPNLKELRPTQKYEFISEGNKEITIEALAIGGIALLGVKPELNCITARQITKSSPFEDTLVISMVNGAAKYMADKESFQRCTYEAMNSFFDKGAAEILCQEAHILLEELQAN